MVSHVFRLHRPDRKIASSRYVSKNTKRKRQKERRGEIKGERKNEKRRKQVKKVRKKRKAEKCKIKVLFVLSAKFSLRYISKNIERLLLDGKSCL